MSSKKFITNKENKANEVLLLKKGKRGVIRMLFGRTGIIIFLLLVQILVLFNIFRFVESLFPFAVVTLVIFSVIMVINVINGDYNTNVKMSWIILIMLLPGFGGLLYIFIQGDIGHRTIKKRLKTIIKESNREFVNQGDLSLQV